jgi:endo-1,4-beta-xylanase
MKNTKLKALAAVTIALLTLSACGVVNTGESTAFESAAETTFEAVATTAQETAATPAAVTTAPITKSTAPPTMAAVTAPDVLRSIAFSDNLPSLKDVYADYFDMGVAIDVGFLANNSVPRRVIDKHFNFLTTGNEFKPTYINPSAGEFKFDTPDEFTAYGDTHTDVKLRGHTLVWHSQVPAWWFKGSGTGGRATSDELMSRMEEYITTVVTRYKGKIDTWDVVNEVMSDSSGDLRRDREMSQWASIVGDLDGDGYDSDFIEQAFLFADKADPDAQLIINEYNIEFDARKLNAIYDLCERMLKKGIPVDGVGFQSHVQLNSVTIETFEKSIEKMAELKKLNPDFKVQITELDVSIFSWNDRSTKKEITSELEIELGEYYRDLFEMFRRQAEKGNLDVVVLWGLYDGASWLDSEPVRGRTNAPLLFDRLYCAKPAFWGVVDPSLIEACAAEPVPKAF